MPCNSPTGWVRSCACTEAKASFCFSDKLCSAVLPVFGSVASLSIFLFSATKIPLSIKAFSCAWVALAFSKIDFC